MCIECGKLVHCTRQTEGITGLTYREAALLRGLEDDKNANALRLIAEAATYLAEKVEDSQKGTQ